MDDKAWDQLFTAGNKTIYKKDEVVGRSPCASPKPRVSADPNHARRRALTPPDL